MSRPDNVVERSEEDDEASHQAAVVHGLGVYRLERRPKAEEDDDEAKHDAESIIDDAEDSRDTERSPD